MIQLWVTNPHSWYDTNLCPEKLDRLFICLLTRVFSSPSSSLSFAFQFITCGKIWNKYIFKWNKSKFFEIQEHFILKCWNHKHHEAGMCIREQVCQGRHGDVTWMREICRSLMEQGNINYLSLLGKGKLWIVMVSMAITQWTAWFSTTYASFKLDLKSQ